ncbi:restriction endonuclease subunit S [Acinetobacter oleivorans]|uniref:restriction endonuclease subunit S n=1 Tax=Acinetobacter oleivorans TaxID=1148157 RepID=UPI001580F627|nr:restriction endonuclease subunit S [Acinetobacter oleivorans]NUF33611.1 restriction endonuclease subunit S [Acinetobacter oleivorans]
MAKYQKYAEYKDSGEWLGEIPLHWDIQPTKRFFRLVAEPAPDNNDYELLSVYTEIGVKPRKELEQKGNKASTTDGYWLVKKGDIVVNKLLAWMGAVGYSEYDGVTSPAYDILRPTKKLNPKFYHYLFRTKIANMEFKRWSRGIMEMRLRLYFDELGRISMPFPTFEEQNQIVDFLDHETAKIDTLIAKQEKLVELLKEKRQAVISHAVTKGLNPNAPMKDSGVEWLGEVPEHWSVSALGYYSYLNTGATPDRSNSNYWEGDIPWIKTGEVRYDTIFSAEESITDLALKQTSVQLSPPGTLLMAMYGQGITRGRVALLGVSATYNQACVAINPNSKVWNEYLKLFFMAAYHAIRDGGNETSQMNLNADIVKKFKITIPPLDEQHQIVENLNKEIPKIDSLIEKAESAIQLMQERRTALISAAVTGKIDVRNWQHSNKNNNQDNMELSA